VIFQSTIYGVLDLVEYDSSFWEYILCFLSIELFELWFLETGLLQIFDGLNHYFYIFHYSILSQHDNILSEYNIKLPINGIIYPGTDDSWVSFQSIAFQKSHKMYGLVTV
jgi:hypothetical protein